MRTTLAVLLLLLPATLAWAQEPAKPLATRDQYRACLASADGAVVRMQGLKQRKADHEADLQRLQADIDAHVAAGAKIKQKDSDLIEAHNIQGMKLNTRRDQLNANADQFSRDVAEHNRLSGEASARCTNLSVSKEDRDAVALERAGKK